MTDPEIRLDQLSGLRTILAAGRADRPFEFEVESEGAEEADQGTLPDCPFCEGNEEKTPPELWGERPGGGEPATPGWTVRAVPNLYPALAPPEGKAGEGEVGVTAGDSGIGADPLRASARGGEPDLFSSGPALGTHEVIIHSPKHATSMAQLDDAQIAAVVGAWRERMRAHPDAAYRQLIVNEGPEAGASLEHTHAQLYALDFVPIAIARERERTTAYNQRTMGGELLSDIASEEVRRGERLVAIDDDALLVCPWASRSPFELRVIPRRAAPSFEQDDAGAEMVAVALRALAARFGRAPQLNLWIHTAPRGTEQFHWHLDIAPRLSVKAGFELSTGVDINVFPPERAAAELRDCLPS